MSDVQIDSISDRTAASAAADTLMDKAGWLAQLEAMTEEDGYLQPLGPAHWAFFTDAGKTLIVSFETLDGARARPGAMPLAQGLAETRGWSHLCLIAEGETWYRDPAVYAFFDRLVDDAFFEDFDRVLFYGAGMGGYAACAYAVVAPGAQVLAISPRATLDPTEAGWDKRSGAAARKLDFTSRYGYAPDMLEGAERAVILYDRLVSEDAIHAALFRAPYVTRISVPLMGERIEWALTEMRLMPELITRAVEGKLTAEGFAALWRKRRDFAPYLRALLARAEAAGKPAREMMICRSVTRRLRAPRFEKRLARLVGRVEAGRVETGRAEAGRAEAAKTAG